MCQFVCHPCTKAPRSTRTQISPILRNPIKPGVLSRHHAILEPRNPLSRMANERVNAWSTVCFPQMLLAAARP